jgi:hypothetical protein
MALGEKQFVTVSKSAIFLKNAPLEKRSFSFLKIVVAQ